MERLDILKNGTVIPATPLYLDKERKFSERGQRLLTRYYLEAGVGGIATCVHTTQFEIRNPEHNLFVPVLRTVSSEIDEYEKKTGKKIFKVCGVCGKKEQAVKEANLAREAGYDAVLLSPGGLNDLSEEEMLERTREVAKIIPVIGFYLQQAVGGRRFSYDYWRKMCEIEGVEAIKCASFNRYSTIDVVRAAAFADRKVALYTGNDDNIISDLTAKFAFEKDGKIYTAHFCGGLLGHWSAWTKKVVEYFDAVKNQTMDSEKMLCLAGQVTDANGALFDVINNFKGCIAGIHEILYRQGLMESINCLNPNETLSKGQSEEIDRVYKMYPHLNDDDFVRNNIESWKKEYNL